jgi:hypothetical protein
VDRERDEACKDVGSDQLGDVGRGVRLLDRDRLGRVKLVDRRQASLRRQQGVVDEVVLLLGLQPALVDDGCVRLDELGERGRRIGRECRRGLGRERRRKDGGELDGLLGEPVGERQPDEAVAVLGLSRVVLRAVEMGDRLEVLRLSLWDGRGFGRNQGAVSD